MFVFADPAKIIEAIDLREGDCVADIGVGSGAYIIAAARSVGSGGKVYAIDVQKELLAKVKNTARNEGLTNVEVIWANVEDNTSLRDDSVDVVIVSNILFQIEDKEAFVHEMRRIVRVGGKLAVIDWSDSYGGLGPDPSHVVTEAEAKKLFIRFGFNVVRDIQSGIHHYGFIANKLVS